MPAEGVRFKVTSRLEKGAYLNLFLRLPEGPVPMKIELAAVRGARGELFGTKFIRIHPTAQERLHGFIKPLEMRPSE